MHLLFSGVVLIFIQSIIWWLGILILSVFIAARLLQLQCAAQSGDWGRQPRFRWCRSYRVTWNLFCNWDARRQCLPLKCDTSSVRAFFLFVRCLVSMIWVIWVVIWVSMLSSELSRFNVESSELLLLSQVSYIILKIEKCIFMGPTRILHYLGCVFYFFCLSGKVYIRLRSYCD